MGRKRKVALGLAALVAIGATVGADADEVVRWYDSVQKLTWGYTVSNGVATISTPGFWDSNARDACKGDIVVPSRIGPDGPTGHTTYPVRDMAAGLFRNCKYVTSVRLPDGIRRIAPNAFYFDSGSTMTNVTIGAGCLDIGENAFCRCHNLVNVNVPDTVTNIAKNAFTMCRALPRIDIPGSVKAIGDGAFSACSALEEATVGDGIEIIDVDAFLNCPSLLAVDLPASVRFIGDRAFSGCSALTSATLREGLESIGNYAFSGCSSLTNASIPASVAHVGESAFGQCPDSVFDKTTVPGVCLLSGWAVGVGEPSSWIDLSGVNGVADGLFNGQRNVTGVVFAPGISRLGHDMFNGCCELKSVALPAALETIERQAFQSCAKLESVVFPGGVTNIGAQAFEQCERLSGLALPAGLALMGDNAFDCCTNLTSLTIPASLKRIPMGAFENCTSLTNVTVEEGVEVIGNAAFYGCRKIPSFTIPDSVTTVEDIAFDGCTFLDTNTIANVAMADGWIVGSSQPNLTEVTVPGDVRGISECAFSYRNSLTNAVVEEGVTAIPFQAFAFDANLTDVSLPASLAEIGKQVFCGCRSLVEVRVPANVAAIGEEAFASCSALERVYLPASLKGALNLANVFAGSMNVKVVYYHPNGTEEPPLNPWAEPDDPEPETETWTVTFKPNGGEFQECEDASREVEKGTAVGTLPVPVREGYAFGGWWTAKTKGAKISPSTKVTKDATYFARWTVRKFKIAATVSAKTAGTVSGAGSKAYGSKATLKATPKKGYVFVKWVEQGDPDTPWPSAAKYRQPSVSFTVPARTVSVKAVFAKKAADAAPALAVAPLAIWHVEGEPGRETTVTAESLSYPAVSVSGQPAGIALVRVSGTDCEYVLKVTDASKMRPGVYTAKITAKNRAGKSTSKSVKIVAPNSTAAVANGLVAGLETSTLSPYVAPGGMKTKWRLADLGVEVFATNGWKLASVTGLPAGLSWNGSAIVGTASKAGIYTVTFKMQKVVGAGKKAKTYTSTATATFKVEAMLPDSVVGTFNGIANSSAEPIDEDDENAPLVPYMDCGAQAVKATVTAAGKISVKIGGVTLTGTGFDEVLNGVYSVSLRKTQKITKGALKGKSKVWVAVLDIDPLAAWDTQQLTGVYYTYVTGLPSTSAPVYIAAQRNAFGEKGNPDAKAVAKAVSAARPKGVVKFALQRPPGGMTCLYTLVSGGTELSATAKSNGTVALAGKIKETKVSGTATLSVDGTRAVVRFFPGKFAVEIVYQLDETGTVDSVAGRVW